MSTIRSVSVPLALMTIIACAGCTTPVGAGTTDDRSAPPVRAEALRDEMRELIIQARDKVFPALVNIRTYTSTYYGGRENRSGMTGSGTIISSEGHVLTNQHVVNDGKKFKLTLADKQEVDAELVGEDPYTDLAILKINVKALKPGTKLTVANFGDSDEIVVGDSVMAMGSPFSLSRSVTLGIVSNTERVFTARTGEPEDMETDGVPTGTYTRWIQHDALINPGNSGGPLVNLKGQIVGVNTRGGSGMGFATPSNHARDIADKLIKFGEVPRSSLGISVRTIDKTGFDRGVLVNSVTDTPPGPAARAGIKAGDLITKLNGEAVTARFAEEIPALLRKFADTPIGSTVTLEVERDGKSMNVQVTTEKMLKDKGDQTAVRGWGVSVEEITEAAARELRLPSRDGVLVTGTRSGSPSAIAEPAIGYGDVIKAVGGKSVKNLKEFVEQYKEIMKSDPIPEFLLIQFDRRGKDFVTTIKPRPEKPQDPPREVPKPWIGVATQPVLRDLSKQLGLEGTTGFRVTRVYPRTLAASSGLQVGDVITGINGTKLAPRTLQDTKVLEREIRKLSIDEEATLTVMRSAKPAEVRVKLERTRIDASEARKDENKDFEVNVRELTFFDLDENQWPEDQKGVMVDGCEPTGWAGQAGLSGGDLILRINDQSVEGLASYRKIMEQISKDQPERVVFVVLRGIRTSFKFVEPEWKPKVVSDKKNDK